MKKIVKIIVAFLIFVSPLTVNAEETKEKIPVEEIIELKVKNLAHHYEQSFDYSETIISAIIKEKDNPIPVVYEGDDVHLRLYEKYGVVNTNGKTDHPLRTKVGYVIGGVHAEETSIVTLVPKDGTAKIETAPIELKDSDTFDPAAGFVSLDILSNTENVHLTTFDDFIEWGGEVDTSNIPDPLTEGEYSITYKYGMTKEEAKVHITSDKPRYEINVKENIYLAENGEHLSDEQMQELLFINVTTKNASGTTIETIDTFERFLALGGNATIERNATMLDESKVVFTFEDATATSTIYHASSIIIETKDLFFNTSATIDTTRSFSKMTMNFANGKDTIVANTLSEFQKYGGTIDASSLPASAVKGEYPIIYAMPNISENAMINIVDTATIISVETHDIYVSEDGIFDYSEPFDSVTLMLPGSTTPIISEDFNDFKGNGGNFGMDMSKWPEQASMTYLANGGEVGRATAYVLEANTTVEIFTKDSIHQMRTDYRPEENFDKMVITRLGVTKEYDYKEFVEAGGTFETTLPEKSQHKLVTYQTTYKYEGARQSANIRMTHVVFNLKPDISIYTHSEFEEGMGFDSVELKFEGGVKEVISGYDEFVEKGGSIAVNTVPNPLQVGKYAVMYQFIGTFSLPFNVEVFESPYETVYTTMDLVIDAKSPYEPKDSFLKVTVKNKVTAETIEYTKIEDFIAAGGKVETTVPEIVSPAVSRPIGMYTTTFTMLGTEESVDIEVQETTLQGKDTAIKQDEIMNFLNKPTPAFDYLEIKRHDGTVQKITDYDEFNQMGGTFETQLKADSQPDTYEFVFSYNGVSSEPVIITLEADVIDIKIDVQNVELNATEIPDLSKGFKGMSVTTNGIEQTYDYEAFLALDGSEVDDSSLPATLTAGTYPVIYKYGTETKTANYLVTSHKIETNEITLKKLDAYKVADSFKNLIVEKPNGDKETLDYEAFLALGGVATTTYPENAAEVEVKEYITTFTIAGVTEEAKVIVEVDVIDIKIDVQNVELNATETPDLSKGFKGMSITTNGIEQTYDYEAFLALDGSEVDDSSLPATLTAGTYPVIYKYGTETKTANYLVTSHKIETNAITLKKLDAYKVADSFKNLIVEKPNGDKETLDYEAFLALDGVATTTYPENAAEVEVKEYITTFTIAGVTEEAKVIVEADVIDIKIDVQNVELNATETPDLSKGFKGMIITTNGIEQTYDYEAFLALDGSEVDDSSLLATLTAGTYPIIYKYGSETKTANYLVTSHKIETNEITLKKLDAYKVVDSFKELIIEKPNGDKETLDYEAFLALGGVATTTYPENAAKVEVKEYLTTFTIAGVTEDAKVIVEADVIDIKITTQPVNITTADIYNDSLGFKEMIITTNGVAQTHNFESFLALGGTVDVAPAIPTPLEEGTHTATYKYDGEEETALITITAAPDVITTKIETQPVNITTADVYDDSLGFKEMIITTNGVAQTHNFESFLALGGTVDVAPAIPTPLEEGTHTATYKYDGEEETALITITAAPDVITTKIETQPVNITTADVYDDSLGFKEMIITTNGVAQTHNFESFLALGGTVDVAPAIPTPLEEGTYTATYTYKDAEETSLITISAVPDVITTKIKTQPVNITTEDTYDDSLGFKEMIVTTNGNDETYTYAEFLAAGGTVTVNPTIPTPLEEGTYTATYTYNDAEETSLITISAVPDVITTKIKTQPVNITTEDTYDDSLGFKEMIVTTNGNDETYTYAEFLAAGGTVTVTPTIPTPLEEGTYTVTYTYNDAEETATITVTQAPVAPKVVEIETVAVTSEKSKYDSSAGFIKMTITENGVTTEYDFEDFLALGGTVTKKTTLFTRATDLNLEVGVHEVIYEYEGFQSISKVTILKDKDPVKPVDPTKPTEPKKPEKKENEKLPKTGEYNNLPFGSAIFLLGVALLITYKNKK